MSEDLARFLSLGIQTSCDYLLMQVQAKASVALWVAMLSTSQNSAIGQPCCSANLSHVQDYELCATDLKLTLINVYA